MSFALTREELDWLKSFPVGRSFSLKGRMKKQGEKSQKWEKRKVFTKNTFKLSDVNDIFFLILGLLRLPEILVNMPWEVLVYKLGYLLKNSSKLSLKCTLCHLQFYLSLEFRLIYVSPWGRMSRSYRKLFLIKHKGENVKSGLPRNVEFRLL